MKPNYSAEGIYGGACLGVRSGSFLCFYDWESTNLIRRIDIVPKEVRQPKEVNGPKAKAKNNKRVTLFASDLLVRVWGFDGHLLREQFLHPEVQPRGCGQTRWRFPGGGSRGSF